MSPWLAEFVGTALLVLMGNGVVANVILQKTKGHGSGLVVIALGWGMAVFVAVLCTAAASGAHLNPSVTLALAMAGEFPWSDVPGYVAMQMLGGMMGAFLVWVVYYKHFEATDDGDIKLAVFCTGPAIRGTFGSLVSEIIATFVLIFAVLNMAVPEHGLGAMSALPVGLVVLGIGVSLGGTTGYAMSAARDLGPRIVHALLPIPGKRDSDWRYAWVPVAGPLIGSALAALIFIQFG